MGTMDYLRCAVRTLRLAVFMSPFRNNEIEMDEFEYKYLQFHRNYCA